MNTQQTLARATCILAFASSFACDGGAAFDDAGESFHLASNASPLVTAVCGNSVLESGETCDDGNTQLGDGCSPACQVEPHFTCTRVVAWGSDTGGQATVPEDLTEALDVALGNTFSLALKPDGTVVAWGSSPFGATDVPQGLSDITAIAAGGQHALALRSDKTVVAWGDSQFDQTAVPASLSNVVAIAGGGAHSLALKGNGEVAAWGSGTAAVVPSGLDDVVAIAAGNSFSLAVKSNGSVVAWGDGAKDQTKVPSGLSDVVAVAGGKDHSLALKANGTVVAWGKPFPDSGQTQVPAGLGGVIGIAATTHSSLALKSDGTVATWGNVALAAPAGLFNVVMLKTGVTSSHVLAITNDCELPPGQVSVVPEWPGANCATGGHRITTSTEDGILAAAFVCNGEDGASAHIDVKDAPLAQCPAGGKQFDTSVGDGAVVTSYVCNGQDGASVLVVAEGVGDNCAAGGIKVSSGGTDHFICNGEDGASAHIDVTDAPVDQCPAGGKQFDTSVGDGPVVSSYLCNGQDGASVLVVAEGAGANCPAGGIKVSSGGTDHFICNGEDGARSLLDYSGSTSSPIHDLKAA